jgi:hypothetical protein
MNLSAHFTLEEFTSSQTAARLGIDNTLPPALYANARRVCERLELVRRLVNQHQKTLGVPNPNKEIPIMISSGYRCRALNEAIGGSASSAHMNALAVDFTIPAFGKPITVAQFIAANGIEFDQLIYEFGTWVHLGLTAIEAAERGEILHIGVGTGYLPGLP